MPRASSLSADRSRPAAPDGPPPAIRVERLRKSFGDNHVLRGIDLTICRGEIAALVGGSGCGKSVLLELMIGQQRPDAGRVLVADHEQDGAPLVDLETLDAEGMDRLRRHWAIVFQRNALFSGTVYENIALWLREVKGLEEEAIGDRARRAVEAVGLDPETILQRDRDDLSGGMAKRVAVARALAMDPAIMLYDEPTTGLDPHHAAQIHDLILQTHLDGAGDGTARTTLIITHDKDLLHRLRPRVIMLHDGVVFFDGSFDRFRRSDSPIIRPYFDLMPVLQRRPLTR